MASSRRWQRTSTCRPPTSIWCCCLDSSKFVCTIMTEHKVSSTIMNTSFFVMREMFALRENKIVPMEHMHGIHGETHQMLKLDVGGIDGHYVDCAENKSKTLDPLRQIHNALV